MTPDLGIITMWHLHLMEKIHMKKYALIMASVLALTACQSTPKPSSVTTPAPLTTKISFNITGKIGITTQTTDGKTGGSAFYGWSQDGERFAIDLTGALGVGATQIRYDGKTATLTSDEVSLSADNPNDLLFKATGWHAPIDKLPHWVMGKPADNDTDSVFDDGGKLTQSKNGDWTATFTYQNNLPNRISMTHHAGHKAIITINHQKTP